MKLDDSAVFLPECLPFLPFPAFVREGKSCRVKECCWCTRERDRGVEAEATEGKSEHERRGGCSHYCKFTSPVSSN